MRTDRGISSAWVLVAALCAVAQYSSATKPGATALPKATLWNYYSYQFQPTGQNGPYHWRVIRGSLPRGLTLRENGDLSGDVSEQGESEFTVAEIDRSGNQEQQSYLLTTEPPLPASWLKPARVNGNRIDGAIKISNTTGRDLDLTFAVLAVNDIGRATAIGYQHFQLKRNTRDLNLPFGDTLSPGNYAVNVDVVGEEPQSKMIFRSRLVTGQEALTEGP